MARGPDIPHPNSTPPGKILLLQVPGEPWRALEGTGEGCGQVSWLLQHSWACQGKGLFFKTGFSLGLSSPLGSQGSLPSEDLKYVSVFSFHLSFDWVEASSLPGINIHNKQRAINLTSWNLLCIRLNSKPASAGCLFFTVDALLMTAPKHLNLKHSIA